MPTPEQVARQHYQQRARLVRAVAAEARRSWRQVDRADIRRSWRQLGARLLVALAGAQLAAARQADAYAGDVLAAQGVEVEPAGVVVADALAGVASDGRDLAGLLDRPVFTALTALGSGATEARAMAGGAATLDMIVRTQVADAGRVADQIAVAARPRVGYVRMVVGSSCARCLILAGRRYEWSAGFQRHPRCDCVHIPAAEGVAGDLATDPRKAFAAMDRGEQNRVFGRSGAEAIRAGADMAKVVNARRGMYTAGGRKFTTEAAGRRQRLMPEQIFAEANGDRGEAVRLLRLHGYLRAGDASGREPADGIPQTTTVGGLPRRTPPPPPPPPPTDPPSPAWVAEGRRPRIGELIPRTFDEAVQRRDAIREALLDVVEGEYAGFLVDVAVESVTVADNRLGFLAVIRKDGRYVGRVERRFYRGSRDGDNPDLLWAEHVYLSLDPAYQGQGFAEAWNGTLERWYRASGLSHVAINADIDVGGYAWARQGFDFEDAAEADKVLLRLLNVLTKAEARAERIRRFLAGEFDVDQDDGRDYDDDLDLDDLDDDDLALEVQYPYDDDLTEDNRGQLTRLLAELDQEVLAARDILDRAEALPFADEGFPTASDISNAGRRPGQGRPDLWIGKRAMLGSDWMGVKWL